MAPPPPSALQTSTTIPTTTGYRDEGMPPLPRSATAPGHLRTAAAAPPPHTQAQAQAHGQSTTRPGRPDPSHLAPEDAFLAASPPRRLNGFEPNSKPEGGLLSRHLRMRSKDPGSRSHSRRRKRPWKKLLWVKQSCTSWPAWSMTRGTYMYVPKRQMPDADLIQQILTTTPTRPPSSRTFSGTLV